MRYVVVVIVFVSLTACMHTTALGDCAKKTAMLHEAVSRLQDLVTSTDSSQQERDEGRIRALNSSITDEDCVGITHENQQLADIIASASHAVMTDEDFAPGVVDETIDFKPIELQADKSIDATESPECRCYARQMALVNIFGDAVLLRLYWPERASPLAGAAMQALWTFLSTQLSTAAQISLGPIGESASAYSATYRLVDSQLFKHCGYRVFDDAPKPRNCGFNIYGVPTPQPTDSSQRHRT
jgi:hypothetical protein